MIVIDAVNQLDDFLYRSHTMEWLPKKLPCKFVISTLPGKCLDNLRRRYAGTMQEMILGPLDVKERGELIRSTLWQYHKKLDERPMNNQMRDLLKKVNFTHFFFFFCFFSGNNNIIKKKFNLYLSFLDRLWQSSLHHCCM